MKTKIIEGTNGTNWGKFLLCRFDSEWEYQSVIDQRPLLRGRGWAPHHLWVMDLQTGEGACFAPGGLAVADLNKHNFWCCPMYLPFLEWLYRQDLNDLDALPDVVELVAESSLRGYRRAGLPFREAFSWRTRKWLYARDIADFMQLCSLSREQFEEHSPSPTVLKEVESVLAKHNFAFGAIIPTGTDHAPSRSQR
jgi:hypothetical protein